MTVIYDINDTYMIAFSHHEIDKIGNTIIYLADKIPNLSKTKLLKLLYLLEHFSAVYNHVPFANLEFEVWQAGPVSKEVFVDLSNETQSLFGDYVSMVCRDGAIGTYVNPLMSFCDDEFSDNDMDLMDYVIRKFGDKTASELVDICHKHNMPWYRIAEKEGLLLEFATRRLTSSDKKIDLSELLSGCDQEFYIEQRQFNLFGRDLKI